MDGQVRRNHTPVCRCALYAKQAELGGESCTNCVGSVQRFSRYRPFGVAFVDVNV